MNPLQRAQRAYNEACELRDAAFEAVEALETEDEAVLAAFDETQGEVERTKKELDRVTAIYEARAKTPLVKVDDTPADEKRHATAKGDLKVEPTYRPDQGKSFFRDLVSLRQDPTASERLIANQREVKAAMEQRDLAVSTDGQFIPPIYLGERWAELPRAGRPFANIVPTAPFPPDGLTVTIPKVSGGAATAIQAAQNNAVQETDPTVTTVTASMATIAGQVDVARQALERSFPGLDVVIFDDLMRAYDANLDTQLLSGTGSSGQHLGVRAVTSPNTESYTDASPTQAELLPKIYEASSKIATTRYLPADTIVMHPRRAAWLAAGLSSTFPLFQQGGLVQAAGTQDAGFVGSIAGLRVYQDPNIGITYGASTNEDEIYVLHLNDLLLMESPVRSATYEDVGSGNLTVRLQLFGYSFFVPHRQVKSICIVSGTGLATPTF